MSYDFESLGPEAFQEFCQAVIVREFPNVQCLPVGQRDGGRDALAFFIDSGHRDFIVFQVKFVRKPLAVNNAHTWLLDVLKEESPKVKNLIPRGASQYVLLTNVPGTAYPESGSIDVAHKVITSSTDIPSQCWWRDDLARRLDAFPDLKWSYPSLITAGELLRLLLQSGLAEDAERRISTIRSFLRDQFTRDEEVRFKQVELQNKLLDLFIDVPLELRSGPRKLVRQMERALWKLRTADDTPEYTQHEEPMCGAATVLLDGFFQSQMDRVVLEGAPGQGKSTVAQYICQIHRRRILEEPMSLPEIPEAHRANPVRLPFKIDLRDFSLWLSRRNPFASSDDDTVPKSWNRSLESFLAAQVQNGSGGAAFDVNDLHAICRKSSVLLVFDGLDEVAEIAARREVVDEVNRAVNRLSDISLSLQTVVTSRTAAFSNSPGFSDTKFVFCELASISRPLIDNYAERWIRARRLQAREAGDVKRILRAKLDQPHLRELARNPMQLAILLSLIHTRGSSLPDKRTALYDAYVELFFSRESEKSQIVREHRDLLINIHQYLAWTLHAQAEQSGASGSIAVEPLRRLVREYLEREGYDPSLADQLFAGMVERVVALVSRVQGTFEFEVQPLREYFAARHLYETAAYSPVGENRSGTLPDRFDALARNFYWLNVTRFYAGCYNQGELPSLVDRLEELSKDENFRLTRHPQELAATLLADWVFAQHPKSMRVLIHLLLDGVGLRHMLLATSRRVRRQASLVLPKGSGNDELIDKCFKTLSEGVPRDYGEILTDVITENTTREESKPRWHPIALGVTGPERTRWFEYGSNLGVLPLLSESEIGDLLEDAPDDPARVRCLLHGGQRNYLERTEERFCCVVDAILANRIWPLLNRGKVASQFDVLSLCVDAFGMGVAFEYRDPLPMYEVLERYRGQGRNIVAAIKNCTPGKYEVCGRIKQLADVYIEEMERSAAEWAIAIEPWDRIVDEARVLFGERWAVTCLANLAAGIRNKDERCEDAADFLDHTLSLCRRIRHARLKSGNPTWYKCQLESCENEEEQMLVLLVVLTWAGPDTLRKVMETVDPLLAAMSADAWRAVLRGVQQSCRAGQSGPSSKVPFDCSSLPGRISERSAVVLGERIDESSRRSLYEKYLSRYEGDDTSIYVFSQSVAHEMIVSNGHNWRAGLEIVERAYRHGCVVSVPFPYQFIRRRAVQTIPNELADHVVLNPEKYPSDIVTAAEFRCRERLAEIIVPVGKVAEDDGWFAD